MNIVLTGASRSATKQMIFTPLIPFFVSVVNAFLYLSPAQVGADTKIYTCISSCVHPTVLSCLYGLKALD